MLTGASACVQAGTWVRMQPVKRTEGEEILQATVDNGVEGQTLLTSLAGPGEF